MPSDGAIKTVVVAIIVALVAGGTSPWWWKVLFPAPVTVQSVAGGNSGSNRPAPPQIQLAPDPFFLSSSPSSVLKQSNVHGGLQLGKVYWQSEVWIEGLRYEHAVGMHAPDNGVGYADFKIPAGANFFQTVFGCARDDKNPNQYGNAVGRIYLDDDLVWESAVSGATAMHTPSIPIPAGTKRLRLEVDSQGTNFGDQTTWGDPNFTSAK